MKHRHCALFLLLVAGLGAAPATQPSPDVHIEMAADSRLPTLVLRLRNTTAAPIYAGHPLASPNEVVMLCPDGSVVINSLIVDSGLGTRAASQPANVNNIKLGMLEPGQEQHWEYEVQNLMTARAAPGVYRVYWSFDGLRSEVIRLYRHDDRRLDGVPTTNPIFFRTPKSSETPIITLRRAYEALDDLSNHTEVLLVDSKDPEQTKASLQLHMRRSAIGNFRSTIRHNFGEDALGLKWYYEFVGPEMLEAIDAATLVYGDHFDDALVTPKGWTEPVRVLREKTRWRVSIETFMKDGKADPAYVRTATGLRALQREIILGTYKTVDEAREAAKTLFDPPNPGAGWSE